jgi:hypothetical protein
MSLSDLKHTADTSRELFFNVADDQRNISKISLKGKARDETLSRALILVAKKATRSTH